MKTCPFPDCDFEAESERGLKAHIRQKHESSCTKKSTYEKWRDVQSELASGGLGIEQAEAMEEINEMVEARFEKQEV